MTENSIIPCLLDRRVHSDEYYQYEIEQIVTWYEFVFNRPYRYRELDFRKHDYWKLRYRNAFQEFRRQLLMLGIRITLTELSNQATHYELLIQKYQADSSSLPVKYRHDLYRLGAHPAVPQDFRQRPLYYLKKYWDTYTSDPTTRALAIAVATRLKLAHYIMHRSENNSSKKPLT